MPQSCCYSLDGKLIAAGCDDGSVQVWKYGNLYVSLLIQLLEFSLLNCTAPYYGLPWALLINGAAL